MDLCRAELCVLLKQNNYATPELTLCSSNSTLLSETEISSASNLDHRKRKINLQTDSSNETSKRKKVEQKNFVCSKFTDLDDNQEFITIFQLVLANCKV